MLLLVAPDRHEVRVVNQNVRRHQHRIGEQPVVRGNAFGDFIFVTVGAFEQAHRRHRREQPGQFGHFWHVGLLEKHSLLRVESAREEIECHLERVPAPFRGVEQRRHRVIVRDEIKRLAFFLQFDGRLHHSEIISEMQRAGGLDTRQRVGGKAQVASGGLSVARCGACHVTPALDGVGRFSFSAQQHPLAPAPVWRGTPRTRFG